jgi:hypothetical protein
VVVPGAEAVLWLRHGFEILTAHCALDLQQPSVCQQDSIVATIPIE